MRGGQEQTQDLEQSISMGALYNQVLEHAVPEPSDEQKAAAFGKFHEWMNQEEQEETAAVAPKTPQERPLPGVNFLTVAEVASVMRVSKMTVYRLVHSSELPAIRVGRSFRVPEQAVHDYLIDEYRSVSNL
ncbi:excisionase family DNA binding protein [Streptacidiphilus sp. EB129]